jgi:putative DNA primase/helicase
VIGEIFEDQPEVVPYMKRVLGYMITGLTDEHTMWFWFGRGANGKSTLINVMHALLGTMAASTSFSTFDDRNDNDKGDDLAILRGKRFVAASEGEQHRRIAEAKVKTVVSSDRIRCRFLYGSFFEYRPTWKLVLATNNLPEIKGTDVGIWRRIHMVQFNQRFEGERRDLGLEIKIRHELPGVLNWCLEGLEDYFDLGGFAPPPSVVKTTEDFRAENDTISLWFEERVVKSEGESLERSLAFTDYRTWCRDSGESYMGRAVWASRVRDLGLEFETSKSKNGSVSHKAKGWDITRD